MALTLWRAFSIFSTVLIIGLLFGSTAIGITKGVQEGNWSTVLKETGGKIFAFDNILIEETDYLLEQTAIEDYNNFDVSFHLIYAFTILFIFAFIALSGYKIGNWLSGKAQFNPLVDIIVMLLVIGIFLALEILYTRMVLGISIYPFQGVVSFISNLPTIVNNLIY